jgi:alcohol dehydrogenase
MLIASYYDGMAFQCGTALPHGMGYPLSHHKGVHHGLACGIFQAEYLRAFKDQSLVEPVIEMCGFDNIDKFAEYIQRFIAMDVHMEVTEEEVREWAELFCKQEAHRLKRHPEPIGLVEVTDIYLKSLANYIR